ncbi:hypothetical protein LCGC14_1290000, partial [marine sediment metagenome]
ALGDLEQKISRNIPATRILAATLNTASEKVDKLKASSKGLSGNLQKNISLFGRIKQSLRDFFGFTSKASNEMESLGESTSKAASIAATAGGVLLLTCQATTDDASEQLTHKGAGFLLAAGKTIWYETRLKIVGDVQSEHSFGLVADGEDLTAVADVLPADGISFSTQDATLAAALTVSKGGTNTGAVAGVHTLVSGTYVTLGFLIDGVTSVTPYVNGVAGTAATATIPDTEHLAPYFLVRNGDGTTQQVMHVDYVKVVQLR